MAQALAEAGFEARLSALAITSIPSAGPVAALTAAAGLDANGILAGALAALDRAGRPS